MLGTVYAHSLPDRPMDEWETLAAHSAAVAELAADFARPFGWSGIAAIAGRLHDIGKVSPTFQDYIAGRLTSGGDHSSAGARIALDFYGQGAAHTGRGSKRETD